MNRTGAGWWLLTGVAFGLAVVTRFQLAVFGVVVVWAVVAGRRETGVASCRSIQAMIARFAFVALGAVPFLLLQMWAWHVVYGHWIVFSYGSEGEGFHWTKPELFNSLFSPWHGLFYWQPLLLVAMVGTVAWAFSRRGIAVAWCLAIAATIYVNASWWCWWFASSFGSRAFDAALLPLMAGAGWVFLRADTRWRRVFCAVAIAAALWNGYVALLYRSGAISRSAPLTWSEMLHAAPRLPDSLRFESMDDFSTNN